MMDLHVVRLDFGSMVGPPARCPGCAAVGLAPHEVDGRIAFGCRSCARQWRFDLGAMLSVGPGAPHDPAPAAGP